MTRPSVQAIPGTLQHELAVLRKASRWPDQEEFSAELGLSLGGYKKYETGERIPSPSALNKICKKLKLNDEASRKLKLLRDDAKARQVGISTPFDIGDRVDPEALAKKVQREVSYVLKQAGIKVPKHVAGTVEKRIAMILKSTLGE